MYEMNMDDIIWNGPYCEVCPYCVEELWIELGWKSQHDMELWSYYYSILPNTFPNHHDAMEIYCNIHYPEME